MGEALQALHGGAWPRAPRARRPSRWAHGCGGTMQGREQGRAPRPSPPIRPGGALTHRTGCTEVRGTFPRLGNHRRYAFERSPVTVHAPDRLGIPRRSRTGLRTTGVPSEGGTPRLGGYQARPAAPVEPSRTAPASPRPAGAVRGPVGPPDSDQTSTQDSTQPEGRTCSPPTARDFWPWAGGAVGDIRGGSHHYPLVAAMLGRPPVEGGASVCYPRSCL